jgi:hypothetical protein
MKKAKQSTHFQYAGRNVLRGSRRASKIDIWERKEAGKRKRRQLRGIAK